MEKLSKQGRIAQLMQQQNTPILSIYFTAGFPELESTAEILHYLQKYGADLIEIGIPYSDPVADGPTIQQSNQKALENGMTIEKLFRQLSESTGLISKPVITMGYFNPILQYGVREFCAACHQIGISGVIIPDLPVQEYLDHYREIFTEYELENTFLITPQTSDDRIKWIDKNSESFIYAVSDASITGAKTGISAQQKRYFSRLQSLQLEHPFLIGFGISDHQSFSMACEYSRGAIIGSAFINLITQAADLENGIRDFIQSIKQT